LFENLSLFFWEIEPNQRDLARFGLMMTRLWTCYDTINECVPWDDLW